MIRKIIVNLITAFFIFPFILLNKEWINILKGNYQYYDKVYKNFYEYISTLLHDLVYPLISFLILIFILLPFQLIKDYRYKKGKKTSFIERLVVLTLIIMSCIVFIGTFTNIWTHPWWYNFIYVFYSLFLSLIFTTITYFLIDKYVEKRIE